MALAPSAGTTGDASLSDEQKREAYWNELLEGAKHFPGLENMAVQAAGTADADVVVSWNGVRHLRNTTGLAGLKKVDGSNVCIIEDITPAMIRALGVAWHIEPAFFLFYLTLGSSTAGWASELEQVERVYQTAKDPDLQTAWKDGTARAKDTAGPGSHAVFPTPAFRTIRGEFLGPVDTRYPARSSGWFPKTKSHTRSGPDVNVLYARTRTCIAWYQLENMLLVLVDSLPLPWAETGTITRDNKIETAATAHPGGHRRAHMLCGPSDPSLRPAELMSTFLQDPICREIFDNAHAFGGGHSLDWIVAALANFSWERSLGAIKSELYEISFHKVQRPNMSLSDRLHHNREQLWRLKSAVAESKASFPCFGSSSGDHGFNDDLARVQGNCARVESRTLISCFSHLKAGNVFDEMLVEVQRQEDMLVQTFQILHSTITIQESQLGIQQSRRAALLTWLAFIYAPLAFVASVFGMNVREINGSALSVWVVIVALLIVVIITMLLFVAYRAWDRRQSSSRAGNSSFVRLLNWVQKTPMEKDLTKLV